MRRGRERGGILARLALVSSAALAALLVMLFLGMGFASAHSLGYDSVDGREIRWGEHTRYDAERRFGINKWNALGGVDILHARSGTDLEFRDYRECGDGMLGRWVPRSGAGWITFNECEMDRASAFDRRGTAVHELGHALGLAHPSGSRKSKYWCKNSVMYYSSCAASPNTPQAHDKSDYYSLWPGASAVEQQPSEAESSDAGPLDMEVRYAFDVEDPRKLVGFATNVFVGRVVEEAGSEGAPLSGPGEKVLPRTQFSVEVLKNVKGDLEGTVAVSQAGGYDEEEDRVVRVEGDSPLEPGKKYLFVTSYNREEGWYAVVAQPFGDVLVEGEARRMEVEERFEQAEEEQIPPGTDPETFPASDSGS